jgi:VCBS repeat-containing protein
LSSFWTELNLIGVNLRDNQADVHGGGIYAVSRLTVINSELTGNWAGQHGGGIFTHKGIDLHRSTLSNNRAGGDGGGFYMNNPEGATTLENNVWLHNQAARGAAVAIVDYHTNDHHIRHNTIVGDGAPESPAIYLSTENNSTSSFYVQNNIIVAHAVGVSREKQGTLTTYNNLYFDNAVNEFGATLSYNHVKADPHFLNLAGNDVRLREESPAIDSAADLGVVVDHNSVDRPQGAGYDIGALEYVPNVPPTAAADAYTTRQGMTLEIPAPGVLDNDGDVNGDPLTAVVENQPAHGDLTLNANGSFTYTPQAGYTGSDNFSYRANDGQASSTPAQVALTILPTGANLPPVAFNDSYEVAQGATLTVSTPGVLGNDQDGDGDLLTAVLASQPADGSLTLNSDGSFTYAPVPGFIGTDSFTYRADDGPARSAPATVTIVVRPGGQLQRLLLPVVTRP